MGLSIGKKSAIYNCLVSVAAAAAVDVVVTVIIYSYTMYYSNCEEFSFNSTYR